MPNGKTLWTILHHTGALMPLRMAYDERMILPLFSSPYGCETWMMQQKLEQHHPSAPLWPTVLMQLLESAYDAGFDAVTIDPPLVNERPLEVHGMEDLMDQVEAVL